MRGSIFANYKYGDFDFSLRERFRSKLRMDAIAGNVTTVAGSLIDIRGGGELYAYRWVQGNGGTQDVLARSTSFAILPGYHSAVAPFGAFANVGQFVRNLGGDPGCHRLRLRDQVP